MNETDAPEAARKDEDPFAIGSLVLSPHTPDESTAWLLSNIQGLQTR